jgi:hypothetical protein
MNCWQPSLKLVAKQRDGVTGKTRKTYDVARTPYRRLLASGVLADEQAQALAATYAGTGPWALRQHVVDALERLYPLHARGAAALALAAAS